MHRQSERIAHDKQSVSPDYSESVSRQFVCEKVIRTVDAAAKFAKGEQHTLLALPVKAFKSRRSKVASTGEPLPSVEAELV